MDPRLSPFLFVLALGTAGGAAGPAAGGPLFISNRGQWPEAARFRAQAGPVTAWLTASGWWLVAGAGEPEAAARPYPPGPAASAPPGCVAIRMELAGARPACAPEGLDPLPGTCHFLLGNVPEKWVRDLPIYTRVRFPEAWPGIDLFLRAEGGQLAYDLELCSGAEIEAIRIRCDGTDGLLVEEGGALLLQTPLGSFRQRPPRAWQVGRNGRRRPVQASFRLLDRQSYGFAVVGAESGLPLVIDPDLTWLTHLGGAGDDQLLGIAREPNGRVTVAGLSTSWNLPVTAGAFQSTLSAKHDAYVARMDPSQVGNAQLVWCTFLGGSSVDCAFAVAVHGPGLTTVVGATASNDYPEVRGLQTRSGGGWDGFVTRLDPLGAQCLFSTYLGGSGTDHAFAVHVDGTMAATISGSTDSVNFPVQGPFQAALSGARDLFACRLDAQGQTLAWSTYLGGSGNECWYASNWMSWPMNIRTLGMDVDAAGRVLLAGLTVSSDFPTRNAHQAFLNGGWEDAFAAILDPSLAGNDQLVWSTYLGGTLPEGALAASFGPGGIAGIGGYTYSSNFPVTPNAFCTAFVGTAAGPFNDGFAAWLDPSRTGAAQLLYATFLGGVEYDSVSALDLDTRGYATLGGFCSPSFPATTGAFDTTFNGPLQTQDAWVAKLRPDSRGTADLLYSTFLGGPGHDNLATLAPTGEGGVVLAGVTVSRSLRHGMSRQARSSAEGNSRAPQVVERAWVHSASKRIGGRASCCRRRHPTGYRRTTWPGSSSTRLSRWTSIRCSTSTASVAKASSHTPRE